MDDKRKIEIILTQQVDGTSVSRSQAAVEQSAKSTAASITATEQAESQKRIAIAEEEAAAKAQAMEQAMPATPSSTVSSFASSDAGSSTERLIQGLEQLQELMGESQNTTRSWVEEMDNARARLEAAAESVGVNKDVLADYDVGIEDLATHQIELHQQMQQVAEGAQALASGVASGKVSMSEAAKAAVTLQQRNAAVAAGMKEMRQDAVRLKADMTATMQELQQGAAGAASAVATVGKDANTAGYEASAMGKKARASTTGMVRGFKAASRAATVLRVAINKVFFYFALANQAWELLTKVMDIMHGKTEAATKAAEAHEEALNSLLETADNVHNREMANIREQKAQNVSKFMEDGQKRVNRELSRGLELRKKDIDFALKQKRLSMDRDGWKLEEEELRIDDALDSGEINEVEAATRRAEVEVKRKQLDYRRSVSEREAEKDKLSYEIDRVQAGIKSAEKDLERIKGLRSGGVTWYSAEQMADKRNRSTKRGGMLPEEQREYTRHLNQTKEILKVYDMEDMFEAYQYGDFDMRKHLADMDAKFRKQLEELQERQEEKNTEWEQMLQTEKDAAAHHAAELESLNRRSNIRLRKAKRKQDKEDIKDAAKDAEEDAEDTAKDALEHSKTLRQQNKSLIEQRKQREGDAGSTGTLATLYDEVEKSGDTGLLRRIIAELSQSGRQVAWTQDERNRFGAGLQQTARLGKQDREWWGERFTALRKSQRLETNSKALGDAAEKLSKLAEDAADNVGNTGDAVSRIAEAYERQLRHTQEQDKKIEAMLNRIERAEAQARHRMK